MKKSVFKKHDYSLPTVSIFTVNVKRVFAASNDVKTDEGVESFEVGDDIII